MSNIASLQEHPKFSGRQFAHTNTDALAATMVQEAQLSPPDSWQSIAQKAPIPSVDDPIPGGNAPNMTTHETELRIQVSEARTDAKFADLIGKLEVGLAEIKGELRTTNARLDHVERATAGTKTTIIITGIAIVAALVAVLGYGQQWFGIGVSTRDVVRATVTELLQQQGRSGGPSVR